MGSAWGNNEKGSMRYRFQNREQVFEVSIERQGTDYRATVDGQTYMLEVLDAQPGQLSVQFDGHPVTLYWAVDGNRKWVSMEGCAYCLEKPAARQVRRPEETAGSEAVRAPMPAQVRTIHIAQGDQVDKGQTLLLLEAMKMEIRIKAPNAGRVARLLVSEGQTVDKDQLLAEIEQA